MNYKEYLRWGIFHITFIIIITIANYKVFGFEFTIIYLMLEIVTSIMGIRLELIRLLDKDKKIK
jgi:hypothetical protein